MAIGRVTWGDDAYRRTAVLHEDGTWTVGDDPILAATLRSLYEDAYAGPQDGPYGVKVLHQVAAEFGGTVELESKQPDPAGTIF